MGKKTKLLIVTLAVMLFIAGFTVGHSVQADVSAPGSVGDPLVSQSYVRSQVDSKNQELQQKIKELEVKAAALEEKIQKFEAANQ